MSWAPQALPERRTGLNAEAPVVLFGLTCVSSVFHRPPENLAHLKKLQYLNLALNNIEVIENLEGQYAEGSRLRDCSCSHDAS